MEFAFWLLANHFYEVSAKVKAPKEETALRRWYRFVPDVFFCIVLGMHFMGTWPKMKKNYAVMKKEGRKQYEKAKEVGASTNSFSKLNKEIMFLVGRMTLSVVPLIRLNCLVDSSALPLQRPPLSPSALVSAIDQPCWHAYFRLRFWIGCFDIHINLLSCHCKQYIQCHWKHLDNACSLAFFDQRSARVLP